MYAATLNTVIVVYLLIRYPEFIATRVSLEWTDPNNLFFQNSKECNLILAAIKVLMVGKNQGLVIALISSSSNYRKALGQCVGYEPVIVDVENQQLTASSQGSGFFPKHSKMTANEGFRPQTFNYEKPWIQVDLLTNKLIGGVVTWGRPQAPSYIKSYRIQYQSDGSNAWTNYTDANGDQKTNGSNDDDDSMMMQGDQAKAQQVSVFALATPGDDEMIMIFMMIMI
ncbi:hypothetical protein CAPTEDRAFT_185746 [Capitella teleta]|uniref:F5/8 type C domain-containing protein n=1 Tax=Capitella teleta TaxID=283909 RepID=R7VLH5_CAPTE|nr:hypothetical protein CAPTEDRAFT_185746 [Capitella teleta]|eukprot:ELU18266.1 hypothetical protein CAPTEDRAFT_185746 [Capitella teleta]